MSNEVEEQIEEKSLVLASADDLGAVLIKVVLAEVLSSDDHAIEKALIDQARHAEEAGDESCKRGCEFLAILCSFHLQIDDPVEVWSPRWQTNQGRSYQASDFRGEQNNILAEMLGSIEHPTLLARAADVVWYNDRSKTGAARSAIDAYAELINRRLSGEFSRTLDTSLNDRVFDCVEFAERALQIAGATFKRDQIPHSIQEALSSLYTKAAESSEYVAFVKLARLGLAFGWLTWDLVATEAEQIAQKRSGGDYPLAVKEVWDLAAKGHAKLGNEPAKRKCEERSVEETLRMRSQVDSASAKAFWTRKAIGEFRTARGFVDRIAELRKELRDLQDQALDEFGQFSFPMDISKERTGTIDVFEGLTLPDALLQFALLPTCPSVEELREAALESRKSSILGSLIGSSYADHEGKTVAEGPAGTIDGEPSDEWIKVQSLQFLDICRQRIVHGCIDPARLATMRRFPVEERHFRPIAAMSPFVPRGHEHLFSLGFARLLQGDHASAACLLLPQLENSLRHVLLNSSRESSKIKPDLLQEDRSLAGLLAGLRSDLEAIFGADLVNEMDLLFHHRPGPALRHEAAHGKLSAGECYHHDAVYGSWLIYRLTCLPLLRHWKDRVAPEIEQQTF